MISHITGLVMLPINTRYLTPADDGFMALFTIATELMGIIVGIRITQAMFRYYSLEDDPHGKTVIISIVLINVLIATTIVTAILYTGAPLFSKLLFGTDDLSLSSSCLL